MNSLFEYINKRYIVLSFFY